MALNLALHVDEPLVPTESKKKPGKKGKGKQKTSLNHVNKGDIKCFFCKNKGHIKKSYPKFKVWLEKEGNQISSHVEAVGTYRLVLRFGSVLDLERTFYVPFFSRNLISISRLLPYGFSFKFASISFHLIKDNDVVGDGILDNGLFKLYLNPIFNHNLTIMHGNIGIKHAVINEKSSILWHKRLGHISIERIKRLVNDGVLEALDFIDFDICMDYIKGKQTNMTNKQSAKRIYDVLEIIQTNISGPYDMCLNVESHNARFLENDVTSESNEPRHLVFEKRHNIEPTLEFSKYDIDIGAKDDPVTFSQAMGGSESTLWYNAIKDEMNSMANNQVWDLVGFPKGAKAIDCKWVFKTKRDSSGNIEKYKARLVAKGFT
uniref:Retrovirus-related Pol polyprotein from transposon TNT 1-94 n=1 Tax=Vitis vinifera TaxID=29760 RepID=A5ANX7_VITVI|nr:hypothetical protein VITISV_037359 [Vitis vinifera]